MRHVHLELQILIRMHRLRALHAVLGTLHQRGPLHVCTVLPGTTTKTKTLQRRAMESRLHVLLGRTPCLGHRAVPTVLQVLQTLMVILQLTVKHA